MEWIRTADLGTYDVISAFAELSEIDWSKSKFSIEKGDIVYIYVGAPYSRIMFKTICTNQLVDKKDIINDEKFWITEDQSDINNQYVRLKLMMSYDTDELSLKRLNDLGFIKQRIQGAYKSINYPELFNYIGRISSEMEMQDENKVLKVGAADMTFHTITEALNYCFNARINYTYQRGTYPQKKDTWKYYMAWFPNFAYEDNGSLITGSKSLDSNWYNKINEDGTEIYEYNYGVTKDKYEREVDFYRLVFGRNRKEDYKFLGVYRMISSFEEGKNYACRRYERVSETFDTSTILNKPSFHLNIDYINEVYIVPSISETEKEILAKSRIGQGIYRDSLLSKYNGKCMLCGLQYKGLLIASHIKEWSEANNDERVDVNNGLLLCTLHDTLFDKHLITFDDNGKIMISPKLNIEDRALCNITEESKIKMEPGIAKYMEYHRNKFM